MATLSLPSFDPELASLCTFDQLLFLRRALRFTLFRVSACALHAPP